MEIPIEVAVELYKLVDEFDQWNVLSDRAREIGDKIVQSEGEPPPTPSGDGMKLSLRQHIETIGRALALPGVQAEFWHTVVKISWTMMAIERDPYIARRLQEASEVQSFMSELMK